MVFHSLAVSTTRMAATDEAARVLAVRIMAGGSDVADTITRLIWMKVIERVVAPVRKRSVVSVVRIVAIVHVTVESMRTMEPGTSA